MDGSEVTLFLRTPLIQKLMNGFKLLAPAVERFLHAKKCYNTPHRGVLIVSRFDHISIHASATSSLLLKPTLAFIHL